MVFGAVKKIEVQEMERENKSSSQLSELGGKPGESREEII